MNEKQLKMKWQASENKVFLGWDFKAIDAKTKTEPLPWSYEARVSVIIQNKTVLDMGTGGGEFLLSLNPTPNKTYATEMYLPNYEYSKKRLEKQGVQLIYVNDVKKLPFEDEQFDLVINRHDDFDAAEVYRILKPGGKFITQQVGGLNTHAFAKQFLGEAPMISDTNWSVEKAVGQLETEGFSIVEQNECYPMLRFYDVSTFVYFAKIIEWEFPGFSVDKHFKSLLELEKEIRLKGFFEMMEHRFYIESEKC